MAACQQPTAAIPNSTSHQSKLEQQLDELYYKAKITFDDGQYTEAVKQCRHLIPLQERVLGLEHEDTMITVNVLATALSNLQQYAEAEALLCEVLQRKQQSPQYDMEHSSTLASVMNLGECLVAQGKWKAAEPMLRKVHGTHKRVLGPSHEQTITIQVVLGRCLSRDGQTDEAEQLLRGAWEGLLACKGVDPRRYPTTLQDLADHLFRAGKYREAEPLARLAVKLARRHVGEQTPATIMCMVTHAAVLHVMGRLAEAELMYRMGLQGGRAVHGWQHRDTLATTSMYITCLTAQHKLQTVEGVLRETVSHLQEAHGEGHATTLEYTMTLAQWLQKHDQRKESKALVRKVRELQRNRQRASETEDADGS